MQTWQREGQDKVTTEIHYETSDRKQMKVAAEHTDACNFSLNNGQ